MQLSIIIPTYNRADVLRRMLNLLSTQTLPRADFEVIVVNDGSTDQTERLLQEFQAKDVLNLKYVSQKNAGQGVARNTGVKEAEGEILLFLGDDMLPRPDLLEQHFRFHAANPELAKAALGLVEWHPEIKVTRFMRWLTSSGVQFKFDDLKAYQFVDFWRFYTANISLKRKFLGTEKFDSDFRGWGFEDAELGYRLSQQGLQLVFWPSALVQHYHAINSDSLAARQFAAGKNAATFQRKHPEVKILPKGLKLFLQKLIVNFFPFTYYAKAKKAYLAGIAVGERES